MPHSDCTCHIFLSIRLLIKSLKVRLFLLIEPNLATVMKGQATNNNSNNNKSIKIARFQCPHKYNGQLTVVLQLINWKIKDSKQRMEIFI